MRSANSNRPAAGVSLNASNTERSSKARARANCARTINPPPPSVLIHASDGSSDASALSWRAPSFSSAPSNSLPKVPRPSAERSDSGSAAPPASCEAKTAPRDHCQSATALGRTARGIIQTAAILNQQILSGPNIPRGPAGNAPACSCHSSCVDC
jgi:hypothetical protein